MSPFLTKSKSLEQFPTTAFVWIMCDIVVFFLALRLISIIVVDDGGKIKTNQKNANKLHTPPPSLSSASLIIAQNSGQLQQKHRRNFCRVHISAGLAPPMSCCRWGPTMVSRDIPEAWAHTPRSNLAKCQQCYFYRVTLENQMDVRLPPQGHSTAADPEQTRARLFVHHRSSLLRAPLPPE